MNLQTRYDIDVEKDQLSDRLEREVRLATNQNPRRVISRDFPHTPFRCSLPTLG